MELLGITADTCEQYNLHGLNIKTSVKTFKIDSSPTPKDFLNVD